MAVMYYAKLSFYIQDLRSLITYTLDEQQERGKHQTPYIQKHMLAGITQRVFNPSVCQGEYVYAIVLHTSQSPSFLHTIKIQWNVPTISSKPQDIRCQIYCATSRENLVVMCMCKCTYCCGLDDSVAPKIPPPSPSYTRNGIILTLLLFSLAVSALHKLYSNFFGYRCNVLVINVPWVMYACVSC